MNPLVLMALTGGAHAQGLSRPDREGTVWLPPAASTHADSVDFVWNYIYWLDVAFFIVIMVTMLVFFVKYRQRRSDERTADIKGNHTLEIAWSVVPGFLLMGMFFLGFKSFMNYAVPPADSMEVKVTGQKWSWAYNYTCPDGVKQVTDVELKAPAGQPVKLLMSSKDVLHSFFVPDFRVKKDVLPNRYTVLWFEAPWPGEHNVFCTEYCGDGHSRMIGKANIMDPQDFRLWLRDSCAGDTGPNGEMLFQTKGCIGCHSLDGTKLTGPSMKGLFGSTETLADGSTVEVDENYLRESIMVPAAKVVAGYPPVMPPFQGQLSDEETDALITYIKSLAE